LHGEIFPVIRLVVSEGCHHCLICAPLFYKSIRL
jgi:hypothetical protein